MKKTVLSIFTILLLNISSYANDTVSESDQAFIDFCNNVNNSYDDFVNSSAPSDFKQERIDECDDYKATGLLPSKAKSYKDVQTLTIYQKVKYLTALGYKYIPHMKEETQYSKEAGNYGTYGIFDSTSGVSADGVQFLKDYYYDNINNFTNTQKESIVNDKKDGDAEITTGSVSIKRLMPNKGSVDGALYNFSGVNGYINNYINVSSLKSEGYVNDKGELSFDVFNFGSGYGNLDMPSGYVIEPNSIERSCSVVSNSRTLISSKNGCWGKATITYKNPPAYLPFVCDDYCFISKPNNIFFDKEKTKTSSELSIKLISGVKELDYIVEKIWNYIPQGVMEEQKGIITAEEIAFLRDNYYKSEISRQRWLDIVGVPLEEMPIFEFEAKKYHIKTDAYSLNPSWKSSLGVNSNCSSGYVKSSMYIPLTEISKDECEVSNFLKGKVVGNSCYYKDLCIKSELTGEVETFKYNFVPDDKRWKMVDMEQNSNPLKVYGVITKKVENQHNIICKNRLSNGDDFDFSEIIDNNGDVNLNLSVVNEDIQLSVPSYLKTKTIEIDLLKEEADNIVNQIKNKWEEYVIDMDSVINNLNIYNLDELPDEFVYTISTSNIKDNLSYEDINKITNLTNNIINISFNDNEYNEDFYFLTYQSDGIEKYLETNSLLFIRKDVDSYILDNDLYEGEEEDLTAKFNQIPKDFITLNKPISIKEIKNEINKTDFTDNEIVYTDFIPDDVLFTKHNYICDLDEDNNCNEHYTEQIEEITKEQFLDLVKNNDMYIQTNNFVKGKTIIDKAFSNYNHLKDVKITENLNKIEDICKTSIKTDIQDYISLNDRNKLYSNFKNDIKKLEYNDFLYNKLKMNRHYFNLGDLSVNRTETSNKKFPTYKSYDWKPEKITCYKMELYGNTDKDDIYNATKSYADLKYNEIKENVNISRKCSQIKEYANEKNYKDLYIAVESEIVAGKCSNDTFDNVDFKEYLEDFVEKHNYPKLYTALNVEIKDNLIIKDKGINKDNFKDINFIQEGSCKEYTEKQVFNWRTHKEVKFIQKSKYNVADEIANFVDISKTLFNNDIFGKTDDRSYYKCFNELQSDGKTFIDRQVFNIGFISNIEYSKYLLPNNCYGDLDCENKLYSEKHFKTEDKEQIVNKEYIINRIKTYKGSMSNSDIVKICNNLVSKTVDETTNFPKSMETVYGIKWNEGIAEYYKIYYNNKYKDLFNNPNRYQPLICEGAIKTDVETGIKTCDKIAINENEVNRKSISLGVLEKDNKNYLLEFINLYAMVNDNQTGFSKSLDGYQDFLSSFDNLLNKSSMSELDRIEKECIDFKNKTIKKYNDDGSLSNDYLQYKGSNVEEDFFVSNPNLNTIIKPNVNEKFAYDYNGEKKLVDDCSKIKTQEQTLEYEKNLSCEKNNELLDNLIKNQSEKTSYDFNEGTENFVKDQETNMKDLIDLSNNIGGDYKVNDKGLMEVEYGDVNSNSTGLETTTGDYYISDGSELKGIDMNEKIGNKTSGGNTLTEKNQYTKQKVEENKQYYNGYNPNVYSDNFLGVKDTSSEFKERKKVDFDKEIKIEKCDEKCQDEKLLKEEALKKQQNNKDYKKGNKYINNTSEEDFIESKTITDYDKIDESRKKGNTIYEMKEQPDNYFEKMLNDDKGFEKKNLDNNSEEMVSEW